MYCMKCGTLLPDNAMFCMNCGTKTGSVESKSDQPDYTGAVQKKAFYFNGLLINNEKVVEEVNSWFSNHRIMIRTISITPRLAQLILSIETVPARIEIEYEATEKEGRLYHMKCFKKRFYAIPRYEKIDEEINEWLRCNPQVRVASRISKGFSKENLTYYAEWVFYTENVK